VALCSHARVSQFLPFLSRSKRPFWRRAETPGENDSNVSRCCIPLDTNPAGSTASPAAISMTTRHRRCYSFVCAFREPRSACSKRLQKRIPERAFHCAEKLKACCVNNEAERIGISADPPLSALAGRNAKMVFSLDWQIHGRRFAFPLKPSLMAGLPPSDEAASLVRESRCSLLSLLKN